MSYTNSQVMLDIETLSTKSNAVIVSIGAVKFCLTKGIVSSFRVNIDPVDCKSYGCNIEKSTVEWWGKQSKEARQSWMKDPQPLKVGLDYFCNWYGPKSLRTWAKGGQKFDYPILENAMSACNIQTPWKYWDAMDYRTIIAVLGINDVKLKSADSVYHDAVSDCEEQCKVLIPLLQALQGE